VSLPPANWDVYLDDACVLCLLFEEGEGDTAHDLSRFRNDGKLSGPTWVGTPFGRGLQFDGVDDTVYVEHSDSLMPTSQLSICVLVRLRDTGTYQYIVDKFVGATNSGYIFGVDPEGRPHVELGYGDGIYFKSANSPVTWGAWTFLALSFNADTGDVVVFKNHERYDLPKLNKPLATNTKDLQISSRYFSKPVWGEVVFVYIFNRALTNGEMRALYQNYRYALACYKLIGQVVNPLISDTYERVELIRKIQTNRWKIENNQLVIYDDDGVTPLKVFNLKDKYGNPSEVNVYEREPAE